MSFDSNEKVRVSVSKSDLVNKECYLSESDVKARKLEFE